MKVLVFEPDTHEPKGIGEIVGTVNLCFKELDLKVPSPKIVMEDGEIVYGFECWWCPA